MSKESIIRDFATKFCGHIDQKAMDTYMSVAETFEYDESYYESAKETVPGAMDGLEDMTEEEIRAHLAVKCIDYLYYPDGPDEEEILKPCAECDQENLKRWIEAVQDWSKKSVPQNPSP